MSAFENSFQEMRGHDRVEISEVIRVTDTQTGLVLGQLVNISEEGFMLLGTQAVAEDNIFQLSLEFQTEDSDAGPVLIGVESLWCHASSDQTQYWSGFYIIDISDVDLERVKHMTG
jgi:hypothetical protein